MRISVDISDEILEEVMQLTGEKSKSASLAKAVNEFVRRRRAQEFGRLLREGGFDYELDDETKALMDPIPPLPCE
jgi:hypothetical protein